MSRHVRRDPSHVADERRCLLGVTARSGAATIAAAAVWATGRGLGARVEVAAAAEAEIPAATAALLRAALGAGPPETLPAAAAQLAEAQATLAGELLLKAAIPPGQVAAVGLTDPGFWASAASAPLSSSAAANRNGAAVPFGEVAGYLAWSDAARLAEFTGLNVLDAFPARDLAQGGLGGPLDALPTWMLLRRPDRNRVLLDLGRTTRLTFLPAQSAPDAAGRVLSFEAGPGTALLDVLAQRLSGGQHAFDPGGRMAAQGQRLGPLLDRWLADPWLRGPPPRWHPHGVRPERFLGDALPLAVERGWSVRDLLCTSTHFIAEAISLALRQTLPEDAAVDELLLAGGGRHNGMLLREIGRRVELPLVPIEDAGLPAGGLSQFLRQDATKMGLSPLTAGCLEPAAAALLALLFLDGVPANSPAITGTTTPRILGRLTPGSPQNWQRLWQSAAGHTPTIRPLRSAV